MKKKTKPKSVSAAEVRAAVDVLGNGIRQNCWVRRRPPMLDQHASPQAILSVLSAFETSINELLGDA